SCQAAFVGEFDVAPLLLKFRVVREGFEITKPIKILQPAVADSRRDQLSKSRIAQRDEAAWCDTVRHAAEFLRAELSKIAQHGLLEQLRVKLCDAVDHVAADAREMCHAHVTLPAFINERESRYARVVAWKVRAHFFKKTPIDLVNDLEVPRQQPAEKIDTPFLERLRQQ